MSIKPRYLEKARQLKIWFLIRSIRKWFTQVPIICLVIGLIQMMEYEVTLDSVRNIDFKIIQNSINGKDLTNKKDVSDVKIIINSLTTTSGWALFPIAVLTSKGCFENGDSKNLCGIYMSREKFAEEVGQGQVKKQYGVSLLTTSNGNTYMFNKLATDKAIMVGSAGAYSSPLGRISFFYKLPYYIWGSGLNKMYSKSKYIWLIISVSGFFIILMRELMIQQNTTRHKKKHAKNSSI